mmetsp:Transcript_11846/g.20029  ORF Transcript_11846/g.20029 Transcript_11846/m.20029 type:complete len:271 (+) Transcript_11846:186-998(+)
MEAIIRLGVKSPWYRPVLRESKFKCPASSLLTQGTTEVCGPRCTWARTGRSSTPSSTYLQESRRWCFRKPRTQVSRPSTQRTLGPSRAWRRAMKSITPPRNSKSAFRFRISFRWRRLSSRALRESTRGRDSSSRPYSPWHPPTPHSTTSSSRRDSRRVKISSSTRWREQHTSTWASMSWWRGPMAIGTLALLLGPSTTATWLSGRPSRQCRASSSSTPRVRERRSPTHSSRTSTSWRPTTRCSSPRPRSSPSYPRSWLSSGQGPPRPFSI